MREEIEKTLLDILFYDYLENCGREGESVRQCYAEVYAALEGLPPERADTAECSINRLCAEKERIAFVNGCRVGARLMGELKEKVPVG